MGPAENRTPRLHRDPATIPWGQEPPAKERGTLYAKVLQDYRRAREQANRHRERARRLHDHAARITATFNTLRSTLRKQAETP